MRVLTALHPALQTKAKKLVELAKGKGLTIIISETVRTKTEQDALYAKGRTAPGPIVTNCQYPFSPHNWGVAFDFAVIGSNGSAAWSATTDTDKDGKVDWNEVAILGKSLGLEWGGDWQRFIDRPHFEMPEYFPGNKADFLIAKYSKPINFIASWEEAKDMEPTIKAGKVTTPGKMINGELWGPARKIAEACDRVVTWDPKTMTATIK